MSKQILLIFMLLLLASCGKTEETTVAEKPERVVVIEVDSSDVVRLDGKEIHISFLENQMAAMAEDYSLAVDTQVKTDAIVGSVTDVMLATRDYASRYITHKRAILK